MSWSRARVAAVVFAGAFAALACASHYSWEARIALGHTITRGCVEVALGTYDDVFDVIATGDDRVALRLEVPGVERDDSPSLSIAISRDFDGRPKLDVRAGYQKGLLVSSAPREHLLARARALAVEIPLACGEHAITLGEEHACGRGEPTAICVDGE